MSLRLCCESEEKISVLQQNTKYIIQLDIE